MSADVPGLVSVVIPCRNEVKAIEATVRALLNSNHPNVEVLVVDGMSEDGTRELVNQMATEDPRVRLIDNPHKLTPYAFNLGVLNARGEYVQIVGSRNVLEPDYIPTLIKALNENPGVACVGGRYRHVYDTDQAKAIAFAMESKFGVGAGNYRTMKEDTLVDTVGIPLYRKSLLIDAGLFDEDLTRNQDDEFNYRLRKKGHKILYVQAAKATYLVRGSLKKAFEQFFQYGYFKVFVNRKHSTVTTPRQLVPALFVAFWPLAVLLGFLEDDAWALIPLAAAVYVLTGLWLAGKGLGLSERLRVVQACFVLHLGYGLGYWQGIFDFLICNKRPQLRFQQQTT